MKNLIESEDSHISERLGLEIKNVLKDIEDLQKSRELSIKKSNERSNINFKI